MTSNFIRFLIAYMYAFENLSRMNFHFYLNKYKKENVGQILKQFEINMLY